MLNKMLFWVITLIRDAYELQESCVTKERSMACSNKNAKQSMQISADF